MEETKPNHPNCNQPEGQGLTVSTTLLHTHPHVEADTDTDPFFSLGGTVTSAVSQFWVEAHKLSCLKRDTLKATPADVRSDFRTNDGCESLCVREAMGKDCIDVGDAREASLMRVAGQNSAGKNRHEIGANSREWDAAAVYLAKNLKDDTFGLTTKEGIVLSSSSKTPQKSQTIVGGVFQRIGGAVTHILASYDIIDDPKYYSDDIYNESENITDDTAYEKPRIDYNDVIINVGLVISSCKMILEYASNVQRDDDFIEKDKFILLKSGTSKRSFRSFCKEVAESKKTHECKLLNNLTSQDAEFLVNVILNANLAQESDDGEIIALVPNGTEEREMSQANKALFRMIDTKENIENRINDLNNYCEKAKKNAIQAKRNKQINLATVHMKRRSMGLKEIDQCANTILNLEMGLVSLSRSMNDVEVMKCFELCRDALKSVRTGDLQNAEEVVDDYMDELNESNNLSDVMNTSNLITNENIDDTEFEEELLELEKQVEKLEDTPNEKDDSHNEKAGEYHKENMLNPEQTRNESAKIKDKAEKLAIAV